jgi:hypothetical protein
MCLLWILRRGIRERNMHAWRRYRYEIAFENVFIKFVCEWSNSCLGYDEISQIFESKANAGNLTLISYFNLRYYCE